MDRHNIIFYLFIYKRIMANTSAIWQQAAHTTYQLSSPSCSTRAIQKSLTFNKKYLSFLEKSQENGRLAEKWQDRKSKRTRQKKTREEIGKGNQMTALRFQTGGWHQTSPASLQGRKKERTEEKKGEQSGKMLKIFVSGELSVQVAQYISVKTTKSVASEQMFYISVQ